MRSISLKTAIGGSFFLLMAIALILISWVVWNNNRNLLMGMEIRSAEDDARNISVSITQAMAYQKKAIESHLRQSSDISSRRRPHDALRQLKNDAGWIRTGQPDIRSLEVVEYDQPRPGRTQIKSWPIKGPGQVITVTVGTKSNIYGMMTATVDSRDLILPILGRGRKHALLLDPSGHVLWSDPRLGNGTVKEISQAMTYGKDAVRRRLKARYPGPIAVGTGEAGDIRVVVWATDLNLPNSKGMATDFITLFISVGLISGILGFIMAGSVTKTVKDAVSSAQLVAYGGPFKLPEDSRITEVKVLSRAMGEMMATISAQRKELLDKYAQLQSRSIMLERVNRDNTEKKEILEQQRVEIEARYVEIARQSAAIKEQNQQLGYLNAQLTRANSRLSAVIEQLKEKDEALKRSMESEAAQANAIIEGTADLVIVTDYTGRIIQANPAAELFFRHDGQKMVARHCSEVISCRGDDGVRLCESRETCPLAMARTNGGGDHYQDVGHTRDAGSRAELGLRWSMVMSASTGRPERAVCIMRDMTRQKEVDRAKSEFVSAVSHELRTPLTSLRGFLYLLSRPDNCVTREETLEYLHYMEEDISRLSRLVEDVLNVSRIEAGLPLDVRRKVLGIGPILESAANVIRKGVNSRMVEITCPSELEVVGDEDKIRQVVSNLLANAVKFSPQDTPIMISATLGDGAVVVSIKDYGCGIPSEEIPRVFERFYRGSGVTGRVRGTGLGLHICKAFVDALDGTIWAESEGSGKGSTFNFTLPVQIEVGKESSERRREAS